ncbi:MAG: T9SS type A sorting domain-containing protein [Candidatus Eisenbacteria bacterium]
MRRALGLFALVYCCVLATSRYAFSGVAVDTVVVGDWPEQGVVISTRMAERAEITPMADGAGGVYVCWREGSNASADLFLIRLTRDGRVAQGWIPGGTRIGQPSAPQGNLVMATDGAEGVFLVWGDSRPGAIGVRLQHLLGDGTLAPGWPAEGRMIFPGGPTPKMYLTDDRAGGTYSIWGLGDAAGQEQIQMQHRDATGEVAAGWPTKGIQITEFPPDSEFGTSFCSPTGVFSGPAGHVYGLFTQSGGCSGHGCIASRADQIRMIHGAVPSWYDSPGNNVYSVWNETDAAGSLFRVSNFQGYNSITRLDVGGPVWANTPDAFLNRFCKLTPDDAGGAFAYSLQRDITVVRIRATGASAPSWGAAIGKRIIEAPTISGNYLDGVWAVTDRAGGVCFVYRNPTGTGHSLHATSMTLDGERSPGWSAVGNPVRVPGKDVLVMGLVRSTPGAAIVVWEDVQSDYAQRRIMAQRLSVDQPVPTQVSLASAAAHADRIALEWFAADDEGSALTVERADYGSDWRAIASVYADGAGHISYDDHDVRPGEQYGYRLRDSQRTFAEVWVSMPPEVKFGIRSALASAPSRVRVEFNAAAGAAAEVSLFDLVGRRITRSRVVANSDAWQFIELDAPNTLAPGLYLVRVASGEQSAQRRVLITR